MKVTKKEFEEARQLLDKKFLTSSMLFAVSDACLASSLAWIIKSISSAKISGIFLSFIIAVPLMIFRIISSNSKYRNIIKQLEIRN